METILVNTSVRINFFNGHETKASKYLADNLSKTLLATCPIIVQEVLQGIYGDLCFIKSETTLTNLSSYRATMKLAVQSASLYRLLRKRGITIRKPNDCTIACYALNNDLAILHDDRDLSFIEENTRLKKLNI